ncbi:MAG: Ig-like domain-containing protein, partial [Anaerolineae bacterium]|nr:Ig-like domain-containing protein [Anaerolineae bacterium]
EGTYTWTVAAYDAAGNDGPFATARTLTVDTTPPEVLSTTPHAGATEVAPDAALVVTFSEAIDTATVEVTVAPDPGVWARAWSADRTVLTLTHTPLAWSTTYTVTVHAQDPAGHALPGGAYHWSFTTRPYRIYLPLVLKGR